MAVIVTKSVTSSDEQTEKMLNLFYPVGSYYETSDTSFDPNTAWGGTWVEDTAGRMLIATDTSTFATVGDTGGSTTHQHEFGMNLAVNYGTLGAEDPTSGLRSYAADGTYTIGSKAQVSTGDRTYNGSNTNTSRTQSSITVGWNGTTKYTSNLPPYIVVKRWHRTA